MQNRWIEVDGTGNVYYNDKNHNSKIYPSQLSENKIENIMWRLWWFEEDFENLQEDLNRCRKNWM